MKKILPAAAALCLGFASAAMAHGHDSTEGETRDWTGHFFRSVDANNDGVIDRDEFMHHAAQKFDMLDANHDGVIDRQEMINFKAHERDEWRSSRKTGGRNKPLSATSPDRARTSEETKTDSENRDK